jgi:hypothetical protein
MHAAGVPDIDVSDDDDDDDDDKTRGQQQP